MDVCSFIAAYIHLDAFLQSEKATYSSLQIVQMWAGTSQITMVVSPLVSVTVVVPGSVSPYGQITHFMAASSWSSYRFPLLEGGLICCDEKHLLLAALFCCNDLAATSLETETPLDSFLSLHRSIRWDATHASERERVTRAWRACIREIRS